MDNIQSVVNENLTNSQPSEGNKGAVTTEEVTSPAPGSKTDSELLLKSLQEERDKRRDAEEKARLLEEENNKLNSSINPNADIYSDEGKILQDKILSLETKLVAIEEEKEMEKIYSKYPILRENANEFIEYRKAEHPRAKIESVAKLFLSEKGLFETERLGLERATGGSRSPQSIGMTAEDVENLRKTNYKEYKLRLMKGEFNNIK